MGPPEDDEVVERLHDEDDRLLFERLRHTTWLVLGTLPFYVVADYYFQPPTIRLLQLEKLILAVICVLVWRVTLHDELRRHARLTGLIFLIAICATSAVSSNLTGQYTTHAFLSVMMTLSVATLAPWGAITQALAVLIVAVSVVWNSYVVTGGLTALLNYQAVTVGLTWVVSVYVAWLLEQSRRAVLRENLERERAEAALRIMATTSAALAYVGEELISAVNDPALLERLSQLTTQMIGCDCSWTVLRKPEQDLYVVAGQHGFTAEQSAALKLLAIPTAAFGDFLQRLEQEEVVCITPETSGSSPVARIVEQYGIVTRMHVALRRGGELIGYHSAAYRRAGASFGTQQERLLRGITNLASLALETTRLVDELNRANRFKSDFVANMSHELRTPLNVIIGYHELLFDGAFGPLTVAQIDTLQRTDQQARALLDLINATLDLSRFEAAPSRLEVRSVDINEVFEELAAETRALPDQPALQWIWEVAPGLPAIHTDPIKLRMVLKNLVQNAMKFTAQGSIAVRAQANGSGVEFRVADTGVGISPEVQARIFEPFFQGNSGERTQGGAGLGLYIVRRLLDLLGGHISVDSELGRGTVFCVWLPFDTEAAKLPENQR